MREKPSVGRPHRGNGGKGAHRPNIDGNAATKLMRNPKKGRSWSDIVSYLISYMIQYESAFFVIPCRLMGLGFDIKVVACRAPLAPLMPMQLWQNGNAV